MERFLDGGCHIDHISGGNGGNGDADSGLSVDAHQVACRGLVAFFNPGNVREPEMLSGARYDCKVAYVVQRIEISGGLDTQAVGTDVYAAGIHNFVLSLECAGDVGHRDAATGHDGGTYGNVYRRCLCSVNLYFGNILYFQNFILYQFGFIFKFAVAVSASGKPVKNAQHIAEVIIHNRGTGAFGQLALYVAYFAAQFVPKLLHFVGTGFFLYINGDFGQSCTVLRFQVIEFAQCLDGLFQYICNL